MHIMHIDMTMYDRLTVETLKEEEILWNLHCYFTYPLCSIFSLAVKRPFVVKKKINLIIIDKSVKKTLLPSACRCNLLN